MVVHALVISTIHIQLGFADDVRTILINGKGIVSLIELSSITNLKVDALCKLVQ